MTSENGPAVRQREREVDETSTAPGAEAESPQQIPASGWWQILKRAWAEAKADQVPLLAAGVAFFGFLALFPAMIAAVAAYGLVADPAQIRSQARNLAAAVPASARDLLMQQMDSLTAAPRQSLGIGLVIALAAALWSASGGIGYLLSAVNLAYDEEETRGFVRRKALALVMTLGAILFVLLAVGLLTLGPAIIGGGEVSAPVRILLQVVRVVLGVVLISVALAVIYRLAPDRDAPRMRWVSIGAAVATVVWLIASIGFSLYVETFGNYAKTYGSLSAVAVLMLWLWLSAYAVLLGAEINAESEEQTIRDTTRGEPEPLGQRRAVKADSLPPS
jgi:membrane protein